MYGKHRIFFVDDEPTNIRIYTRFFKPLYDTASARSGEEALTLIPEFRPDLILLDIMMPGIDGYETCRRIRQDSRFEFTKIILVSARQSVEERLEGYDAGADDYIAKPFDNEELKAKVRVFLRLKRSEQIDRLKGDIIGLFSHETKTPISAIIGLSEMLLLSTGQDSENRECLELIRESGQQLLEFVNKTALLSRLRSDDVKLVRKDESLKEHIEKAVTEARQSRKNRKVGLTIQDTNDCSLNVDWSLLDCVLKYLCDNAIKYAPEGAESQIWIDTADNFCEMHIKNDGDGIPPEHMEKLFDEFSIRDIKHHQSGQGLSLAIANHIAKLHGGALTAKSEIGKGATFTLSLPMS